MENTQKLTEQELQEIKEVQQQQEILIRDFGQLEYQIQLFELQKEKLVEKLEEVRAKETDVANKLNEKYGNGSIDIENGIFTKQ
jgi:hypothetical protein